MPMNLPGQGDKHGDLYGYTMCYRFTKDKKYLQQAEKIAAFMLNHPNLPKDLVPYWDFNAPDYSQ